MDSRKQCQCKVLLLDGTDMNIVILKNATGRELYDQVFYALDLEERDYFGLQFMDHYHVQHWLDPIKRINKQVPIGPPYTFRFRVKFYSSEPNNLREELTRYQFFLQLKQDIQTGRLECPKDTAIELAALALQSELGDYNPTEHTPALISEFRFHPEQDEEMEIAILEKFVTCRGQSPATAEINYLNKAKWIELYGVDMHTVEGKDGNLYSLGLTPTGMLVFDGTQKIGLFLWEKIQKLDFKNRKITLVVEEDADQASRQVQLHTFVFNLSSHKACKHLWKCAIEHHTFFRLKYYKPRIARASQLFRLGSTFRYRGRTEYENVHKDGGRLSRRQSVAFERRPSQRYGPRQSLVNRRIQIRNDFKKQIGASSGSPTSELISSPETLGTNASNDRRVLNSDGISSSDATTTVTNDLTPSKSTSSQIMDEKKKADIVDIALNVIHEATPRWSASSTSATSVTTPTRPANSYITKIAVSNNNSQPTSNNNSISVLGNNIPSSNIRQSLIPRNFSESSPSIKSSGSSLSSATTPASMPKTSPSKIYTGSSIPSPLSSIKTPLNQTYVVLPAKGNSQNSTIINGHARATASIVNGHQEARPSTIPAPATTPTASSSSTIVRSGTFTRNDQRKQLEKAEYDMRSDDSNNTISDSSRMAEPQSRIPHLRTVKSINTSVAKKVHVPAASAAQASTVNVECVEEIGDKTYRSRLPIRNGSGSSIATGETHTSRTSDEKISQSRIPVMTSAMMMHRPHSHTQFTGQMMTKPSEASSTNSRVITDL
ncbi:unnamed protein product [Litomosoides sigmodontis]|uniref:Moesin/ezrin/radixin homolog 1 n=1 Tax=Litomosoides sigmodontis TaxID=42156 RepID=A0A3P6TMC8_LITSI|nr:unnamed protein product [Litomosoides sigmodontis]